MNPSAILNEDIRGVAEIAIDVPCDMRSAILLEKKFDTTYRTVGVLADWRGNGRAVPLLCVEVPCAILAWL